MAIGFMLTAMCFTFGYISGAYFNPAISFAVFINRKMSLKRFISYIFVQLLGSFCASLYGSVIVGLNIPVPQTNVNLISV